MREATAKPIVGVGRYTNPDAMAEVVARASAWDLIGAARPSIADPFLPGRSRRAATARCASARARTSASPRPTTAHHLGCTAERDRRRGVPPRLASGALRAGGERRPRRARRRRGTGGDGVRDRARASAASAASTSSRPRARSAAPCAGSRSLPGPRRVGPGRQLAPGPARQAPKRRGADRARGSRPARPREYGAEIVICATGPAGRRTGSTRSTHDPIPGRRCGSGARPHARADHGRGKRPAGRRVVRLRQRGLLQVAAALAEQLAREGLRVELVTPFDRSRPLCDETLEGPLLRQPAPRRRRLRAPQRDRHRGSSQGRIAAEDEFGEAPRARGGRRRPRHPAGLRRRALPRAHGRRGGAPSRGCRGRLSRSATASRRGTIADAVFDGHRLGREIDSENPAVPLPHRRELPSPARAAEAIARTRAS